MARVSIGVPVYNGERYLADALESLLAQSFKDFEIVISDNASTDATPEIGRAYQSKDPRVRYFKSEQNRGAAWNFNRAFELSTAPLFKWAACDDLHEERFLERCVEVLDRDGSVVLSHTYCTMIDERGAALQYDHTRDRFVGGDGRPIPRADRNHIAEAAEPEVRFRDLLTHMWWCVPSFGVMRRDAFLKTSDHGDYWGADKVFLAELALQGRFCQVPEALFAKRVHDGCSYGKDTQELEEHINTAGSQGLYHFMMFRNYLKIALTADLTLAQRTHCLLSVAGLTLRGGPWREILHQVSGRHPAKFAEMVIWARQRVHRRQQLRAR
jgi:glycosyltransferase involved in cell wall biosynthesis